MLTPEKLIEFGFREWPIHSEMDRHDRHWQYTLKDDLGIKFSVQVRLWQFSKYATPDHDVKDSWDAWVQFDVHGERTFDVTTRIGDLTPKQIVDWFDNLWHKLECAYYDKYSEE